MSPIFAMGLFVCVLFSGLSVDLGRMELKKIQMQSAADAAALGAELETESGSWQWIARGQADAALNGFTDGANSTTVAVVQNPTSGAYAGRYDAIQVTITQSFHTLFLGMLNQSIYNLSVQGVALVPPCSYFLGGSSSQYTYTFQNASATLNSACPVYVNYSYVVDGFSKLYGFGIDVTGPSSASPNGGGQVSQQSQGPGYYPYQPATNNTPLLVDPLPSIVQPSFSGCTVVSASMSGGSASAYPGTYCGTSSTPGFSITNETVTLAPGLYIITGGATCSNSTISGTGVTLFFTQGNGAGFGKVLMGTPSPCTLNISAPTDSSAGGIPGVVFFTDRSWVSSSASDFQMNTNCTFSGDGIWYLPNTGLYIWQNRFNFTHYGSVIARNIYFYNTNINEIEDYSWLSGGSPFRTQAVLVQ